MFTMTPGFAIAVYAMSSGTHYCLVVEGALDVLDSLCNNSLAFLQKTAQNKQDPKHYYKEN